MALIDQDKIVEQYKMAHTAMRPLWDNFDEYERIARNKPHPKVVQAKLPTVTDGTLAGIIAAQPKRVIHQIPTGRLRSLDQHELAEIATYIWLNEILPNANYNGTPLQKSWIMTRKALTYGCQASYSFFKKQGDYYGVDFSIPYIRDIIFESGKSYGPDCDILYMRQWYTEAQVKLIIERETKLKARNSSYEGKWDIDALKKALELKRQKDADAATPQEREKGLINKFIEIIHCFQVGIEGKFYSFSPDIDTHPGSMSSPIVRRDTNPDPRGRMPINFMYADIDLSSALGIGYPEMAGGMQNLLDSEVQAYQFLQILGLNPPVAVWGTGIKKQTVKYKSGAVWDMGPNPEGTKFETVDITTEAAKNFASNYGLIKSQILNLTPQSQANISSEAGNSQSKTTTGVDQLDRIMGFEDNYVRKMFETWWQDNAETCLNIHFARAQGTREVELTEDYLKQLPSTLQNQAALTGSAVTYNLTPGVNPDGTPGDPIAGTAKVDYSQIKTKLKFIVDPTSSKVPEDEQQAEDLDELIQEAQKAPYLYYYMLQAGSRLNLGEAYKERFRLLGIRNIDKIIEKLPVGADGPTPEQLRGVLNPLWDKPSLNIPYDAMPAEGQVQALANAGINVDLAAVLRGPVLDPNARGVETPVTPANPLLPSGDNGVAGGPQQPALGADGKPLAQQPTTPAGQPLGPTPGPVSPAPVPAGPIAASPASAAPAGGGPAQAMPPLGTSAQPIQPPANGNYQPSLPPEDRQLIQTFLVAGYDAKQAVKALTLAKKGMTTEQIKEALGDPTRPALGTKKKVKAKA